MDKESLMDEMKHKLLSAQSVEEVAQVLKEAGDDEAKAEKAWEEILRLREQAGKDLSLDELDAVAGGLFGPTIRWWNEEGCAATVEPGSSCWGTDGDCTVANILYKQPPCNTPCPFCGAKYTTQYSHGANQSGPAGYFYLCRECKKDSYFNQKTGQWEEYIW